MGVQKKLFLVFACFAILFLLIQPVYSVSWWDSNWEYRKSITIIDTSGSELTDFQVPIDLTTALYDNTGLVGSWHFSEETGTVAKDFSGNNNNGTLINGPVWTTGKFGNGLQFDGVNDFIELTNSSSVSFPAMTLSAWVNFEDNTLQERIIVGKHLSGNNSGYFLEAWNNKLGFWVSGNPTRIITTEDFNGAWHYVTGVYDNGSMKLYVDSVLKVSGSTSGIINNTQNVSIGRINNSGFWDGVIDEVKIYNRALSETEIQDQFNATKGNLDYSDLRFTANKSFYKLPLTINGHTENLTDYQTFVNITDPAVISHIAKEDAGDLRFFETETTSPYSETVGKLSYWIEEFNSGTNTLKVWVKTDLTANTSKTVYVYYGNLSVNSESNESIVFDFFDDFNDDVWTDKWENGDNVEGSVSESGGVLTLTGNHYYQLKTKSVFSAPLIVETRAQRYSGWDAHFIMLYSTTTNDYVSAHLANYGANWYYTKNGDNFALAQYAGVSATSAWKEFKVILKENLFTVYRGNSLDNWDADTPFSISLNADANSYNYDLRIFGGRDGVAKWDWIRVRKHASTQPTINLETESVLGIIETEIPHWQENDSKVWVKVPSVLASGSTNIYMYYGNASAVSASDVDSVLDFYSDGESLDMFDSSTYGSIVDGYIQYVGPNGAGNQTRTITGTTFDVPFVFEFDGANWIVSWGHAYIYLNGTGYSLQIAKSRGSSTTQAVKDTYSTLYGSLLWSDSNWYHWKFVADENDYVAVYRDDVLLYEGINAQRNLSSINDLKLKILVSGWSGGTGYVRLDNMVLRKYVSDSPTVSFGVQEQFGAPTVTEISLNFDSFEIGDLISATATAIDPNEDPITQYDFRVLDGVGNEVLNPTAQGSSGYSFTAENGELGLWQIKVKASDGEYWGSEFTKTVFVNNSSFATASLNLNNGTHSDTELSAGSVSLIDGPSTGTFITDSISPVNFSKWGV
ncbi:MAG: DUF2341 domain-containing protein, partial [Candidatus Diapherotrites archaeon]|nr:DUF2341 domain-containing protein [Candidatus Diapherotrites archaeon]